ncbi:hypothetical protein [Pseudaeromonas paramecii]|uniref:Uncharacterized protein n=1 Tax=Pseudaeromonas paramecii TaxID=2138166 RepID=A0ABP8QK89_9GAMM
MQTLTWTDKDRLSLADGRLRLESAQGVIEIDLASCHAQWQARHPGVAALGLLCVGERDITAQPPYFHFFAGEGIRVQMSAARRRGLGYWRPGHGAQRSFLALQRTLEDAGWSTRDLS